MKRIEFDFENMGGVSHVYAVPPDSYLGIRKDYTTGVKYVRLKSEENIIEVPVYADGTFGFSEELVSGNSGDGYQIEIVGVIPKIQLANVSVIELLERGEWLVLCRDMNGELRLSGDNEVKLKFKTKKSTGTSVASRNQIEFTFSCLQENPSVFVSFDEL